MADKPPDAFLSYTRFDDQYHGGAISQFRDRLRDAVRAVTARPFDIFQDVDGIGLGQNWRRRLRTVLGEARFFIPIVTPSYFESRACRDELETFLAFERESGRDDLVLPIYWLRCAVLENPDRRAEDPLAEAVNDRQRKDWRGLRHKPYDDPDVREALESLAEQIDEARDRVMPARPQAAGRTPPARPRRTSTEPTQAEPPAPTAQTGGLEPGTVFRDLDAAWCPEMVVVPPGTFLMGSPEGEEGSYDDEKPQHAVTIAYGLAVGRHPVTFEEYDHFCGSTHREPPGDEGWGRDTRPVINVSWQDTKDYAEWLASETGQAYRLLSEAEWEYACRAGSQSRYWWGDDISPENANYAGSDIGKTTEVGSYPPNPFGLYDMHGNVWEWCEDCWHENYRGAPDDGSAWITGDDSRRVLRGGSRYSLPVNLRAAFRDGHFPVFRDLGRGFRVARTLSRSESVTP